MNSPSDARLGDSRLAALRRGAACVLLPENGVGAVRVPSLAGEDWRPRKLAETGKRRTRRRIEGVRDWPKVHQRD